jgi:S-adenosylmethionine:tRNA ribosyltransferase-isomerase
METSHDSQGFFGYLKKSMHIDELDFPYPENLVAREPQLYFRSLWVEDQTIEDLTKDQILERFTSGDVLVINDTLVLRRRIFSQEGFEILFIEEKEKNIWEVLFPSSRLKRGQKLVLPEDIEFELIESGIPQRIRVSKELTEIYFASYGELPIPPYIQKARGERHNSTTETSWYQTEWAQNSGSLAAPTASLHFTQRDLDRLSAKGVEIVKLTLHVGLGTFLPVQTEMLESHQMHKEIAQISAASAQSILRAKAEGRPVWALGTTVVRTLESWGQGRLTKQANGNFEGATDLFIYPGFEFKIVDNMMTNFHQPKSTLLAMVSAFYGLEKVQSVYRWAIEREFRLFSYGDLTVWIKKLGTTKS